MLVYGGVCSLQVHAIMGKNGSGKSTLTKVRALLLDAPIYLIVLLLKPLEI
jgi:ABC-type cobalamin/Fe3+-siderophores transport system ATPase subunit